MKALIALICLPQLTATAQSTTFTAKEVTGLRMPEVESELAEFSVYELDMESLSEFVQSDSYSDEVAIDLPGHGLFDLDLFPNPLKSADYVLTAATADGEVNMPSDGKIKTFKGYVKGGQYPVRLTVDRDFISGYIKRNKDELILESARFHASDLPGNYVLVYKASDITGKMEGFCSPHLLPQHITNEIEEQGAQRAMDDCLEVEIALADDWLMYEERDENLTAVENHNMAVLNNVEGNYDDEFAHDMVFELVQIWVSTCSTCDPWTSSTNSSALLNDFSGWAGSGFSFGHDVASLWSDRDFNGSTIGLAWLDAVCFPTFKYNVLQDFTGNSSLLRVLQAHEFGHNFGSGHDAAGSGTIMAPSVNNTSSWSGSSVNQIDDYIDGISCLAPCASQLPPVAAVTSDITEGCAPLTVAFEDISVGSPTEWNWLFPGGSPGASSDQFPIVTYIDPGTYDVTLEVVNGAGSDIITLEDYITVLPDAIPDFTYTADELTLFFTNLSLYADSYLWDFGDGDISTDENPVHSYDEDGVYDVVLTATNECGDETFFITIEVVSVPFAGITYGEVEGCVPLVVEFESISSDNVEDFLWEFEGGDPSSSSLENPVVSYDFPGIYSVTLTVSNSAGEDQIIETDVVVVEPLPTADFTTVVNGNSAVFTNLSMDAYGYFWDFGDGNTSGAYDPSHDYESGGTYTVMLISENDCGTDTAFMTISVSGVPIAGIGTSVSSGCSPLEVQYMSTGTGDVDTYAWSFPGGNPVSSDEQNPVVTYNGPGSYDATLIVTNGVGADTIQLQNVIVVHPDVDADMSFDVSGQVVDFMNESSGEDSVLWIIDGTEYTADNPTVDFGADGEYEVTLIAMGPCGSDTIESTVVIATPPQAGLSVSASQGCEPFVVEFTDESSQNVISWDWSFPGGNPSTSDEQNPTISYSEPGTYNVTLVVTSAGGTDEVVMNDLITVDPLPEAIFTTVQSGTMVEFENNSEDATSYEWLFGDGNSADEANPTHVYDSFGEYEVTLIATNACGSDTTVLELVLAGLPVPDFRAVEAEGCAPFEVRFRDESQNDPTEWEWSFPGGEPAMSTAKNPKITYHQAGVYDVTLKVTNSAGAQAIVKEEFVVIGDVPLADFTADVDDDAVDFTNESLDADGYLWDFGDGSSSEETSPMHVYAGTGTYTVTLIATNECGNDTFMLDVTVQTSAFVSPEWGAEFEIWPNPNNGSFHLDLSDFEREVEIVILDVAGRKVYSGTAIGTQSHDVNIGANIAPGLYYVAVSDSDKRQIAKFIVQ